MLSVKGIIDKVASRKLAVTAATGAVEITLPVAIVAAAYVIGQGLVDTWSDANPGNDRPDAPSITPGRSRARPPVFSAPGLPLF